jgi:hypothetical protein
VVLALYAYKLDHGAFPEDLSELAFGGRDVSVRDPCGEGQFGYRPSGFPKPVLVACDVMLPAGQPLIWSAGAARAEIVQAAEPVGQSAPFQAAIGDFYATNSMSVQMGGADARLHTMTPNSDRIVLVILGLQADPVLVLPPGAELRFTPDAANAHAVEGEVK